ncbi:hypothetical protein [Streptomyces griseocarneus]|uniref:hypothetical protein n=1 Tax=Streptomyces griseocarneus TaxID=51201 RepID=UPI00167E4A31|nr:hypothetical protein [Streptomyces griseocarneus]MBZ6474089.1 hypothetical protein [Streptomyces griseocarneus]GHG52043.1 hypothetical protein GCM10018779_12770 [Streptomyces griseocarneus]
MPDRRFTAAAAVLTGLLVLGPAATAHAHGDTIRLTVTGVSAGHPTTTATWEDDGHPVNEKVAGTLTATSSDGTTLGPWRFVPVPGRPGTFTTAEALPAGRWTVTAQTAFPALGRAEAETEVTAASLAAATGAPAGPPAPSRAPSAAPAADTGSPATSTAASDSDGGPSPDAVTFGVTALAVAAVGIPLAFRLRRRGRRNA